MSPSILHKIKIMKNCHTRLISMHVRVCVCSLFRSEEKLKTLIIHLNGFQLTFEPQKTLFTKHMCLKYIFKF